MDFKKLGEMIIKKARKWGADEAEAFLERTKNFDVIGAQGRDRDAPEIGLPGAGPAGFREQAARLLLYLGPVGEVPGRHGAQDDRTGEGLRAQALAGTARSRARSCFPISTSSTRRWPP